MSEWKKVEQPLAPLTPEEAALSTIAEPPVPLSGSSGEQTGVLPAGVEMPPPPATLEPPDEPSLLETDTAMLQPEPPVSAGMTDPALPEPERIETPVAVPVRSRRYMPDRRPGRHRLAAPLGFMVIILALVGVVSLVVSGWGMVKKAPDPSPLKEEMATFLEPIMLQNPAAFSSAKQAASSPACIKAALWKVTEAERIRMRQKKEDSRFETDDSGRVLLPEKDVTNAFHGLFGDDISPDTAVFSQKGDAFSIWYEKDKKQYHVPAFTASLYQPLIASVNKKDDAFLVKVGYVAAADIAVDDQGNDIPPAEEDASLFQQYTVQKAGGRYRLTAIDDIKN